MAKTIFEELGGKYERQGDYLIPCIALPAEEEQPKLSKKWDKVAGIIKSGSWKAIFAETESEYNQIVAETKRMADKAGYAECSRWCEREARRRHASEE